MIKHWWHQLSSLGLRGSEDEQERSRWIFTNRLSLLLVFMSVLALLLSPWLTPPSAVPGALGPLWREIAGGIIGLIALALARRRRIQLAKFCLIVLAPLAFLAMSWWEKSFIPLDLLWLPVMTVTHPVFPHLLFHRQSQSFYFWASLVFTFALWLGIEPLVISTFTESNAVTTLIQENYTSYKSAYFFYFLLVNVSLFYLNHLNGRYVSDLKQQARESEAQKEQLAQQHEEVLEHRRQMDEQMVELEQQSEHIKQINTNLEFMVQQRTQELEVQNKQLAEFAYINGHLLRGPLCRVQGLIYLMELSDKVTPSDPMYHHLKESMEEFSEIISHINRLVEEGKHFERYDFTPRLPDAEDPVTHSEG